MPVALGVSLIDDFFQAMRPFENQIIVGAAAILALAVAWPLLRLGLRKGWPRRNGMLLGWGIGAIVSIMLTWGGLLAWRTVRDSSKLKAMLPRQPSAALDQFFLENPDRIFVRYDEIVGPNCYIKAYSATDGVDLSEQFPVRQGICATLSVRLPDGSTVERTEVLAAIGKSGLVATYPLPQDNHYDRKRVYRLDNGVTFQDWHVVRKPPDPDGREGRDQDGVHTYQFPDGRRFEVTYRGGTPDGQFRAFHANGTRWGEATYRNGRVVEAWLFTRDGRKFNELKQGEAAQKAVAESLVTASKSNRDRGFEKLRNHDNQGAMADFTSALAINPRDAGVLRARGDARKATGDLDGAIADWCAAEGFPPEQAAGSMLPEHLSAAFLERGRQRQTRGNTEGAARDFRVVSQTAFWRAEELLRDKKYADVITALAAAIEVDDLAELHDLRSDARRGLNQLEAAEADCTRALELAAAPKMRLPVNRRIFTAQMHYKRGHLRRWLGRLPDAAADFRAAMPGLGTATLLNQDDAACWLFITLSELGRREDAVRELSTVNMSDWGDASTQCARFLLGQVTEQQLDALVAKSNQDGDRLNANLFSGILRRLAGDDAGALDRFRRAATLASHDDLAKDAARREVAAALRAAGERK